MKLRSNDDAEVCWWCYPTRDGSAELHVSCKSVGLVVIERLRNLGSIPDAVAHRCILGKDT